MKRSVRLDLSDEQLMELLMTYVQSPNENLGAWRTLRS